MSRDLRSLPKAHLHLHFEGGMRRSTLLDFSERYSLPDPPQADGSFATFHRIYQEACQGLRSEEDVRRLCFEVVEDAANDGAVWIEPSGWVTVAMAERSGLPSTEAVLQVLIDGLQDAAGRLGIGAGLMVSNSRTAEPAEAEASATLAAKYAGRGVVAFGLAGDEVVGPAEPFRRAFEIARAAGLIAAPHGGELCGPERVWSALDVLGASRVQHGVRSVEDPALLQRLAQEQVCLDVCPTSNVQLQVVPSIKEHPLPKLLAAGIPVSLNADDPLVFGSGLLQEYELARDVFGLNDDQLAHIAGCSIRASGAPESLKQQAIRKIDAWLSS